jgi:type IV fimbrial biogenesis protein FimT
MRSDYGFTLLELILVVALITVLSTLAFPGLLGAIANYRLRAAAADLHTNMQLAKIMAIRKGIPCKIDFKSPPDGYHIDCMNKDVFLATYGSGVHFERPSGNPGAAIPTVELTFNARGTCNSGSAYLTNANKSAYYRVWTWTTGVIRKRRLGGAQ